MQGRLEGERKSRGGSKEGRSEMKGRRSEGGRGEESKESGGLKSSC